MKHHTLFNDKSHIYERSRPTYPEGLYTALVKRCPTRERVWDCACGNGQAAIGLSKLFQQVEATDVSSEQIANAKSAANIHYQVSPAESTPFSNQSFDLICVAQALHWFDYEKFWPEVQRVLKPNGVFATWGYNWPIWGKDLEGVIRSSILEVITPYFAPHNQLLWNHYRDIVFPFERVNRLALNMSVDWNLDQLFDFLHSASATRVCMQEQGDDFFKSAYAQTRKKWGDPTEIRTFEFDTVFILAC